MGPFKLSFFIPFSTPVLTNSYCVTFANDLFLVAFPTDALTSIEANESVNETNNRINTIPANMLIISFDFLYLVIVNPLH
jgi:hypothetical protein